MPPMDDFIFAVLEYGKITHGTQTVDPRNLSLRNTRIFPAFEYDFVPCMNGPRQWEPLQGNDRIMSGALEIVQETIPAAKEATTAKDQTPSFFEGLSRNSSPGDLLAASKKTALSLKDEQMKAWMNKLAGKTGRRLSAVSDIAIFKEDSPGPVGEYDCTFPGCSHPSSCKSLLERHMHTHYPGAHFCPVCKAIFTGGEIAFQHHLRKSTQGKRCARRLKIFGIDPSRKTGALGLRRSMKLFNFYYLDLMNDYPMPRDHFRMLAGKERGL